MATETFQGKSAIITGASSGIGRALALQLAREGASVALAARNADRLQVLAAECRALGGKAEAIPTDVAEEAQCKALVARAGEAFGRIDMLVNNAGMSVVGKLDELPDLRLFHYVMDVNFFGALSCCYYALPHLQAAQGRIVNVSSLGGLLTIPYNTSYCASKFALQGFSDSLRMELKPRGVSVTVISPYWVVTEFHEHYLDKDGKPKGPSGRAVYTGKMMTAEKCARIILEAARRRKREVLMGPGRLGMLLRWIAPSVVDRITVDSVMRPIAERVSNHRGSTVDHQQKKPDRRR
ncbi:MAG: SDR family oxidoreductase [Anaerolineales bacterium]